MKTNEKKHFAKLRRLEKQIEAIEKRNPNFNFYNAPLISDLDKHRELVKKKIVVTVDIEGCQTQRFKCENYICR